MPNFELVSQREAAAKTATGKRAQVLNEYVGYIGQLASGRAGKLKPTYGEKASTIRRRIGDAARSAGKDLVIKRTGEVVYFWLGEPRRRRGRPRKDRAQ